MEDKEVEITQSEWLKEKRIKRMRIVFNIRSLWDNFRHANIPIMGVRIPNTMDPKRPKLIIIKMPKVKDKKRT